MYHSHHGCHDCRIAHDRLALWWAKYRDLITVTAVCAVSAAVAVTAIVWIWGNR